MSERSQSEGVPASSGGRAGRPTAQAPSGLGDTATIPNAALSAVERIAKGMFECEHPGAEWNGGRARSIWFSRAYAALWAVREPTYDQCHAALRLSRLTIPAPLPSCKEIWASEVVWRAMVDAALAWPTSADVEAAKALAAGSRRAKTPKAVECEASQSGPDRGNAQDIAQPSSNGG